jgi:hypothetical protein
MFFRIEPNSAATVLRLVSRDGTNRLTRAAVLALTESVRELSRSPQPLIITGNDRFFFCWC